VHCDHYDVPVTSVYLPAADLTSEEISLIEEAIRRESGSGGFVRDEDGFRGYSFHLDSSSRLLQIILATSPQRAWIHEGIVYDD
jgi:hypothetical protein